MMNDIDRFSRLHKLLLSLNAISAAASDSDGLLERVVAETMRFTDASGAVVEMVDGDDLAYIKAAGQIAAHVGLRMPLEESLSGLCVRQRAIQRCDDTEVDSRVNREACRRIGIRSMLVVPLLFGDDVVGVVKATSERASAFNEEHVEALQLAAGIIAATVGRQAHLETSRREGEALSMELQASQAEGEGYRRAALFDALTGLPNRRNFEETLDVAMASGHEVPGSMALLFVDMNGFKSINDKFGHNTGDQALCRVAEVLRTNLRTTDFVARLAGDEFVVLLRDLTEATRETCELSRRLLGVFDVPQTLGDGGTMRLSIAIGAALYDRADLTRAEWLHNADAAMYEAKQSGSFCFHGNSEPLLRLML
jgi:diguanylate cyclase (GGDEF)-like protein